jgi:BarA-like signal transduction histidine kinase
MKLTTPLDNSNSKQKESALKRIFSSITVLTAFVLLALPASEAAQAQVSAETLRSISIPDKVDTPIGKLEFL